MITREEIKNLHNQHNEKLVAEAADLENFMDERIKEALRGGRTTFEMYIDTAKYSNTTISTVLKKYVQNNILKWSGNRPDKSAGGNVFFFEIVVDANDNPIREVFRVIELKDLLDQTISPSKWPQRGRISF